MKRLAILLLLAAPLGAQTLQPIAISAMTVEMVGTIPEACPADINFTVSVTATNPNTTTQTLWIGYGTLLIGSVKLAPGGPQTVSFPYTRRGVVMDGTFSVHYVAPQVIGTVPPPPTGVTTSNTIAYKFDCTAGTLAVEKCEAYDPQSLRVVQYATGQSYSLVHGRNPIVKLKDFARLDDALLAVSMGRRFTSHCVVQQTSGALATQLTGIMEYWK